MRLALDRLCAAHPGHPPVLHDVSLDLAPGEIGALMGPSGSGKSTLLRVVAGLHRPRAGRVLGDADVLSDAHNVVPPARRGVGLVFQDLALLPHRTAAANIAYGLFRQPRAEARARVEGLLDLVGLGGLGGRYPHQLSGGQQQRVALARALAPKPRLLLLDEPFSSLDEHLRERLCQEVRGWLKRENVTALAVTHAQAEAFALADRVGVLNAGRLEQWAAPEDLYHRPASAFVAGFVGEGVLLAGTLEAGRVHLSGLGTAPLAADAPHPPAGPVTVLLRPDGVRPDPAQPPAATVVGRVFRGGEILYRLRLDGAAEAGPTAARADVLVRGAAAPGADEPALGDRVGLRLVERPVVAFAA